MVEKSKHLPSTFYRKSFSRNEGLVSPAEQEILRKSCVAVAGLGGVGGLHLVTLARMGIGRFHIADLDRFEIANLNRQKGASTRTLGMEKVEAMKMALREINPDIEIGEFKEGIHPGTVGDFLHGADLVIDAIDFFAMSARELLHENARNHGKTVLFSAPLGFSGTLHAFTPQSMSFHDYFDLRPGMTYFQKLVAFSVGLTPWGTHWSYTTFEARRLAQGIGPSICSACDICAGLVATEALVCLLGRRKPLAAPHYTQFDPYRAIYRKGRIPWGNRNPIQLLKRRILARRYQAELGSMIEGVEITSSKAG